MGSSLREQEVVSVIESEQKIPRLLIVPMSLRQYCLREHVCDFIVSNSHIKKAKRNSDINF